LPGSDAGLTRRDLLISGAAAAGYALAAGPVSARAIHTDSKGLLAGPVEIEAAGGAMPAYRARPAEGETPSVVLVVHEIFGVHEYIRDVCRRLAREGYLAVAPDLYRRHGDVSKLESIDEIISKLVRAVPDAEVLADLDAALAWAGAEGGGDAARAAITGFCWGGRIVWLYAAHAPTLRAGAAWYGRLTGEARGQTPRHPIDLAEKLKAPVLGLYGSEDRGIPLESVDAMRARLASADGDSEIVVFPGAPHGFHADYRPSYRELAAAEAWRRMLAWFREHGAD
jgi:carboxymethylenebutenolidase